MWTPRVARSAATTSRAPATATPAGWATIRCWPPGPTAARCCMPDCARARPTARGILRLVDELVARLPRAGASGELTLRADSGFWSAKLIKRLRGHRVRYSITVRQTKTVRAAIAAIPEAAWVPIAYQRDGLAQVAETPYQGDRLIVRRVRNQGDQAQLFATWRYSAFVTDRV